MAKPTALDRLIAVIAPGAALARVQARTRFDALNGGYKGASTTRQALAGWNAPTAPPDEIAARDIPTLHARSLDLQRDNPLAAGAHHTKAQGVVGTGLKLNAAIDRDYLHLTDAQADDWEARAEHLFSTWAASKDCHLARTLNFREQQDVAFRAVLHRDHFVQLTQSERSELPFRLALNHISSRRVCNPDGQRDRETLVGGIERTANGAPLAYHVLASEPNSARAGYKRVWQSVPVFHPVTQRRVCLHLYRALEPDQTRGIPDLAAVIEPLKQLDRYTDAEIDAAVKNALYAILIESDQGASVFGEIGYEKFDTDRATWYDGVRLKPPSDGSHLISMFPGDKVSSFDPARPNAGYDPFVNSVFKQIGVALELPYEVLTKSFQSSYSAARAALLQAQQFFNGRRTWLADNFCQPVYAAFIDEQVAAGRLAAPGYFADPLIRSAYLGAEWIGDAPGHIDESKAVAAAMARIEGGLSTRKREIAALTGEDSDKVRRQLAKEQRQWAEILPSTPPVAALQQPASAETLDRADLDDIYHAKR